jgi:hypothetical protein
MDELPPIILSALSDYEILKRKNDGTIFPYIFVTLVPSKFYQVLASICAIGGEDLERERL